MTSACSASTIAPAASADLPHNLSRNLSPSSRPMRDEGEDQGKDKGADESRVGRINRSRHGADNAASPSSRVATTVNNWVNPSNSMTLYTGA